MNPEMPVQEPTTLMVTAWYRDVANEIQKTPTDAPLSFAVYLEAEDPYQRGLGHAALVVGYYLKGPGSARTALAHADMALTLLHQHPEHFVAVLLMAINVCFAARLKSLMQSYLGTLQSCMTGAPVALSPWQGRFLFATGEYHSLMGQWYEARQALHDCILWQHENLGPSDEHDRRCCLAKAHLMLCKAYLVNKEIGTAQWMLKVAQFYMPSDSWRTATQYQLEAQIAIAQREYHQARRLAYQLMQHGGLDYVWGVEILAQLAQGQRKSEQLREQIVEAIQIAARLGQWPLVQTLTALSCQ